MVEERYSRRFDVEKMIEEIQARPCLWNSTARGYMNKDIKREAWLEVTLSLFPHLKLDKDKRRKSNEETDDLDLCFATDFLAIELQKKWKNVRDCYRKELKKIALGSQRKNYIYGDLLGFLKDCPSNFSYDKNTNVQPNLFDHSETMGECSSEQQFPEENIVKQESEPEIEERQSLQEEPIDEDKLFLLSLIPAMRKMTDLQKMDFKIQMLQSIKTIQYPEFSLQQSALNHRIIQNHIQSSDISVSSCRNEDMKNFSL